MNIRILPMSKEIEFNNKSIVDVQKDFFFRELPENGGLYKYRKSKLIANQNDLILFQYDNSIIAVATLIKVITFEKYDEDYKGAYQLDVNSIAVCNPIAEDEIKNIWVDDFSFSQVKHKLPISVVSKLIKLLNLKNINYYNKNIKSNEIPNKLLESICTIIEVKKDKLPFKYRGINITIDLIAYTLEILNEEEHNELPQNSRNEIVEKMEDGLDKRIKIKTNNNLRTANIVSDVLADIGIVKVFKRENPKTGRYVKWTRSFVNW